jgi:hypothetical protein
MLFFPLLVTIIIIIIVIPIENVLQKKSYRFGMKKSKQLFPIKNSIQEMA